MRRYLWLAVASALSILLQAPSALAQPAAGPSSLAAGAAKPVFKHVPSSPSAIAIAFINAMNAHDVDAAAKWLAPDFVRFGPGTNWQPLSRAEYLGTFDNFFEPFPDLHWEVLTLTESSNIVAVQIIETGTFTRPWNLRGKVIPPNNNSYELHSALFFWIRDGLIYQYKYTGSGGDKSFDNMYGDLVGRHRGATLPGIIYKDPVAATGANSTTR